MRLFRSLEICSFASVAWLIGCVEEAHWPSSYGQGGSMIHVAPIEGGNCIELLHDPTAADSPRDQRVVVGRNCAADTDPDKTDLRLLETHISCGFNSPGDTWNAADLAKPIRFTLFELTALTQALTVANADGPVKVSIELDPSPGIGDHSRDEVSVTAFGADGVTRDDLDVGALVFESADDSSTGGLLDALGRRFEEVYADSAIGFDAQGLIPLQQDLGFCTDPQSADDCFDWCVHVARFTTSDTGLRESAALQPTVLQLVPLWERSPRVCPHTGLFNEDGWFGVPTLHAALDGFFTSDRPTGGSMVGTTRAHTRLARPSPEETSAGDEGDGRRSETVRTPSPNEGGWPRK